MAVEFGYWKNEVGRYVRSQEIDVSYKTPSEVVELAKQFEWTTNKDPLFELGDNELPVIYGTRYLNDDEVKIVKEHEAAEREAERKRRVKAEAKERAEYERLRAKYEEGN